MSYSCARWPAGVASLSECDASLSPTECLQFHREQGALIEVYFEQLNYESLMESEAYGVRYFAKIFYITNIISSYIYSKLSKTRV